MRFYYSIVDTLQRVGSTDHQSIAQFAPCSLKKVHDNLIFVQIYTLQAVGHASILVMYRSIGGFESAIGGFESVIELSFLQLSWHQANTLPTPISYS